VAETAAPPVDAGERGQLTIRERAITRIAACAALSVPGVLRQQTTSLTRWAGRDLPRAEATVAGGAVAVNLYVALTWPCHLHSVSNALRATVSTQIEQLTGMPVTELNVVVAGAEASGNPPDILGDLAPAPAESRAPCAEPAAVPLAIALALAALGLFAVCVRELLIIDGRYGGAPWLRNTVEWAARFHWTAWLLPIAGAVAVLGALCILLAMKPRPATHVPLRSGSAPAALWARPTDLARACSSAALTVGGVQAALTTVDRKRITVQVRSQDDEARVADAVADAVEPVLALLDRAPELRVRVRA
jgi:uncharacterized alkaline shock family protein YloU